jgi:hypothetical protein
MPASPTTRYALRIERGRSHGVRAVHGPAPGAPTRITILVRNQGVPHVSDHRFCSDVGRRSADGASRVRHSERPSAAAAPNGHRVNRHVVTVVRDSCGAPSRRPSIPSCDECVRRRRKSHGCRTPAGGRRSAAGVDSRARLALVEVRGGDAPGVSVDFLEEHVVPHVARDEPGAQTRVIDGRKRPRSAREVMRRHARGSAERTRKDERK